MRKVIISKLFSMLRSVGVIVVLVILVSFTGKVESGESPLAIYSSEWKKAEYQKCNTAKNTAYFTQDEKEVLWILNMARSNPSLFARTVVKNYPDSTDQFRLKNIAEYKSLLATLENTKKLTMLVPDSLGWISAKCHAISSGLAGYVGHDRQGNACKGKIFFNAECCDYGNDDPLDIIMNLLIDEGVPSLGHREILLSDYHKAGVSIQPHKTYGYNTVIDFQ